MRKQIAPAASGLIVPQANGHISDESSLCLDASAHGSTYRTTAQAFNVALLAFAPLKRQVPDNADRGRFQLRSKPMSPLELIDHLFRQPATR